MTQLADLILVVHFLFVLFVAGGLAGIWLGAARHWRWVRSRRFRQWHLAAIGFVALEGVIGMACPLTVWEDWLRQGAPGLSFMRRWVGLLLYWDLPEAAFTGLYIAAALAAGLTYFLVPPDKPPAPHKTKSPAAAGPEG